MRNQGLLLLMWKHCLQVFLIPFAVFSILKTTFHFTHVFSDTSLTGIVTVGIVIAVALILAVSVIKSLPLVITGMVLAVIAIAAPPLYVGINGNSDYIVECGIYFIPFGLVWALSIQPRVYFAGYNALDIAELAGNLPEGSLSNRFIDDDRKR